MRRTIRSLISSACLIVTACVFVACSGSSPESSPEPAADAATPDIQTPDTGTDASLDETTMDCDAEPIVRTTADGIDFVRTPDACFADLVDWPFEARYVELDGLRQAYVDEGPADGPVVLLLHGQPSWSYLYRHMIPPLVDAGYRVIAMDHLGMGRSDKPLDVDEIRYLVHCDRLIRFIEALGLTDINLFAQDWGSLIGLRVAGLNPDRFARIAIGDGDLPDIPEGLLPPVENPDEIADIPSPFDQIPEQQPSLFEGCTALLDSGLEFGAWMRYAMTSASFHPAEVLEAMTWFPLSPEVEAAYDAPFPSRVYMAGPRKMPSMITEMPGQTAEAWAGLTAFERPFLTLWAANDPGNLGQCATQQRLIDSIPGAAGQPHDRLPEASHFLQDDQGPAIAARLATFFRSEGAAPFGANDRYCEILLGTLEGDVYEFEVWGTQGLNDCPADAWEALDPEMIAAEHGVDEVVMNGPRYWLPNVSGSLASVEIETFGALTMIKLATFDIEADAAETGDAEPYTEEIIERTTTFTFPFGTEIYELTAPDGSVYVMQSMSQIIDPALTLDDLRNLGEVLALPEGWTFNARTLPALMTMVAAGEATVIQDELDNTYQLVTDDVAPPTPGPGPAPLADGTGTPCATDADCAGLEASTCITSAQGGFCTIEGCTTCGEGYLCCSACNPAASEALPFEDSACFPEAFASVLTDQAGCACE